MDLAGLRTPSWGWEFEPDNEVITPLSRCSIGNVITACSDTGSSIAWASAAANLAGFYPFTLARSYTVAAVFWVNGSTSSGNVDVGIYDTTGTKKASIGSTAQGTINVFQSAALSVTLTPGQYFFAMVADNATGQYAATTLSVRKLRAYGVRQRSTSFPLPADASTWAGETTLGYVPFAGISRLSTL